MHIRSGLGTIAAAVLWLAASQQVHAVTLHAGDSVIYNFDFTGQSPAPPYALYMDSNFLFGDTHGGDMASFQLFGGLNGSGGLVATVPSQQLPLFSLGINDSDAALLDGVYSIRLIADQGQFDILEVSARAFSAPMTPVAEIAATLAVPEPASLALFGTMVAAAALRRRRAVA